MPFNGSGTFVPVPAPDFPAVPGTTILSSSYNLVTNDLMNQGLTKCMTRDGQSPPTADIPMGGFKLTGLAAGIADTDAAQLSQTLAVRGIIGAVDWNTRNVTGIYEGTAAAFTLPAVNFPSTTDLGQLYVAAQGLLVTQYYITATTLYTRQRLSGVWSVWVSVGGTAGGGGSGANYLINGGLRIWQASTSLASGTGKRYAADQVFHNSTGTSYTAVQTTWAPGADAPGVGAQYYLSTFVNSTAAAGNFNYIGLPIEDVRALSGKQVTLSFWVTCNISQNIAISVEQNFGSGGSTTVDTFMGTLAVTGSWVRVSLPFTVPSIVGKTIGSTDSFQTIKIWTDAGATFNAQTGTLGQHSGTYGFSCLKLEDGAAASGFALAPIEDEFMACWRYYYDSQIGSGIPLFTWSGNAVSAGRYYVSFEFPAMMWKVPAVTQLNASVSGFPATTAISNNRKRAFANTVCSATTVDGRFSYDAIIDARM